MRATATLLVRAILVVALLPAIVEAAVVRVDFTGTIGESAGVLAGTTGVVSGFVIYNSAGVPTQTSPAIYRFAGDPYALSVSVPGISPVTSQEFDAVVGDDGSDTPYDLIDFFAIAALHLTTPELSDLFVAIYWQGPTSSFTGETIPTPAELTPLTAGFGVWQHGNLNPLLSAVVTTQFTAVVPVPPAVWLLGTGIVGLGGRHWVRRKIGS